MTNELTPSVVLVHGAFADASHWTPVIRELQARAVPVLAPANPLRGLAADAAYIASSVNQVHGPVLLVGHFLRGCRDLGRGRRRGSNGRPRVRRRLDPRPR